MSEEMIKKVIKKHVDNVFAQLDADFNNQRRQFFEKVVLNEIREKFKDSLR